MLVPVVLFFKPIKLFCESDAPAVTCACLCSRAADERGAGVHLPAKCTDCWIGRAVPSGGGRPRTRRPHAAAPVGSNIRPCCTTTLSKDDSKLTSARSCGKAAFNNLNSTKLHFRIIKDNPMTIKALINDKIQMFCFFPRRYIFRAHYHLIQWFKSFSFHF